MPRFPTLVLLSCLPLVLLWPVAVQAQASVQPPVPIKPTKLGQCVACHGVQGRGSAPGIPHLAGQDEQYLVSALLAYRSGQRRSPVMNSIANTLQPRDIQALSHWYSRQPAGRAR